jgi:hypothetical protein
MAKKPLKKIELIEIYVLKVTWTFGLSCYILLNKLSVIPFSIPLFYKALNMVLGTCLINSKAQNIVKATVNAASINFFISTEN